MLLLLLPPLLPSSLLMLLLLQDVRWCCVHVHAEAGRDTWAWGARDALGLEFLKRPPDGSADACVSVLIAPSYVTYVPQAVAAAQRFFTTRRTLELATLQVRA